MTADATRHFSVDLQGRVAVVTGASRGLGAAIVRLLAHCGATVHAVARGAEELAALAADSANIRPWVADAADAGFHAALAAMEVDLLVNNAGTNAPMPMADVPDDVLDRVMGLNLRAAYLVAQAAVRSMLRHGRGGAIVNITSQMGHVGSPGRTVYCMTKHGLEGLTKAMAVELAPNGIRVNSVAPTFIETPLTAPMLADPAFRAFVTEMIPLGRIGKPEDVAAAVAYLLSDAAGMVTGTSLLVDGGWTAR
ncbi:SDR family NAD(P)-dependent oxidoreductase [Sandaracinobacteroides saxicola]|uniref:SDR family oxidoreductase n=1 Tax=Sandaracinobacteroides saxicola TaxID=2759707 RepID=A0A7G5IJN4_9SPHN|nr:SDR family oxidoreductase [Sandaracinobacteroides saxicola]QMW23576.1 SDR family oxidoreductase [Sandaracinobacteroides saxicola]